MAQEIPMPTRRDVLAGAAILAFAAAPALAQRTTVTARGMVLSTLTAVPAPASPALWCRTGWRW